MTTAASQQNPPQEPLTPGEFQLTRRELEVAALVAEDLSDKQIAKRLGISQSSVKQFTFSVRLKLAAKSRVGIAVWYVFYFGFPTCHNLT